MPKCNQLSMSDHSPSGAGSESTLPPYDDPIPPLYRDEPDDPPIPAEPPPIPAIDRFISAFCLSIVSAFLRAASRASLTLLCVCNQMNIRAQMCTRYVGLVDRIETHLHDDLLQLLFMAVHLGVCFDFLRCDVVLIPKSDDLLTTSSRGHMRSQCRPNLRHRSSKLKQTRLLTSSKAKIKSKTWRKTNSSV